MAKGFQMFDVNPKSFHQEGDIGLREFYCIAIRYKHLIAAIFIATIAVALLLSLIVRPLYQAEVSLALNTSGRSVVKFQNLESQDLSTREYIQTQLNILSSSIVAENVVRKLNLMSEPEFNGEKESLGLIKALKLQAERSEGELVQKALSLYMNRLVVSRVRNTSLLTISFESFDPEMATKIADAHAQSYISISDARRFNSTSGAKEFLEKEIRAVQLKLEVSEKQLNDFARQNGVVSVEDRNNIMVERLTELNRSLSNVQASRINAETKVIQASSADSQFLESVYDDPLVSTLRQEQAVLKSEYLELSKVYKPKYPSMLQLAAKIAEIEQSIQDQTSKIIGGFTANFEHLKLREALLSKELETLKTELLDLQDRAVTYNILNREWQANKELYSGLLERTKEVGLVAGIEMNIASIIDRSNPSKEPSFPNIKLNLLIAAFLGMVIGLGAVFVIVMMDGSIKTHQQLYQITGVNHLEAFPKIDSEYKEKFEAIVNFEPSNEFSESIQSLRASLPLMVKNQLVKSLMITSSLAGEGKSMIASNLAISCANAGRRVILFDADFRCHNTTRVLDFPSSPGLLDYLSGDSNDVHLYEVDGIENLSVLTRGAEEPNHVDLLDSQKMRDLLKRCENEYDLVIVDSSAVLMFADTLVVSKIVDSVLFVVQANQTSVNDVEKAIQRLTMVGAPLLGSVLNKV